VDNPFNKRSLKVSGEDHAFENIEHLEKSIKFNYKNFLTYQTLDEDCLSDDIVRDISRIAQQLLDLIGHHDAWSDDINTWEKEQNERAPSDLWRSICDLPPDPFSQGRSQ
jgi:hypothetical protein